MAFEKYFGFEKKVDDALREARGEKVFNPVEEKIRKLERRIETEKLSHSELVALQQEVKRLKAGSR